MRSKSPPFNPLLSCNQCGIQDSLAPGTFHCRICHRCVRGFDHHCFLLCTCIGWRNRFHFIALLAMICILIGGAWLWMEGHAICHTQGLSNEQISMFSDCYPFIERPVLACWCWRVFFALLLLSIGTFFSFHVCYLIYTKQTTYSRLRRKYQ
jgi:hypothetical protein